MSADNGIYIGKFPKGSLFMRGYLMALGFDEDGKRTK